MWTYKILRADRASVEVKVDDIVYPGNDCYGCASDDSRLLGIDHIAMSLNKEGTPFFTIPRDDVEYFDNDGLGKNS
jgi:hypothetical protein